MMVTASGVRPAAPIHAAGGTIDSATAYAALAAAMPSLP